MADNNNNNNNYEYDDYVDERGDSTDFGGPLLVPFLMFLIIVCFCGQSCLLIHLNCSDMFIRGLTNAKIKVLTSVKIGNNKQDDDDDDDDDDNKQTEVHNNNDKNNLDLSTTNNSDVNNVPPKSETFDNTPPKFIRMGRRNSM